MYLRCSWSCNWFRKSLTDAGMYRLVRPVLYDGIFPVRDNVPRKRVDIPRNFAVCIESHAEFDVSISVLQIKVV